MAVQEATKSTTPERRTYCAVIRTPLGAAPSLEIGRERVIDLGAGDTVVSNLGTVYSGRFSSVVATASWATYIAKMSPTMTPIDYMTAMAQLFDDLISETEHA